MCDLQTIVAFSALYPVVFFFGVAYSRQCSPKISSEDVKNTLFPENREISISHSDNSTNPLHPSCIPLLEDHDKDSFQSICLDSGSPRVEDV